MILAQHSFDWWYRAGVNRCPAENNMPSRQMCFLSRARRFAIFRLLNMYTLARPFLCRISAWQKSFWCAHTGFTQGRKRKHPTCDGKDNIFRWALGKTFVCLLSLLCYALIATTCNGCLRGRGQRDSISGHSFSLTLTAFGYFQQNFTTFTSKSLSLNLYLGFFSGQ